MVRPGGFPAPGVVFIPNGGRVAAIIRGKISRDACEGERRNSAPP